MKARPLFIGLLAGLVGVALLLVYLRRVELDASGGRKVQILVAREAIARGKPITDAMLGTRDVPLSYIDERVIRASDKEKILSLKATNTIPVSQSLAWTDVMAVQDDQRALSSLVQPGNRAMPIQVHFVDALPLIHPGDFVDVICVCGESKSATVLLQRVLVLATGTETTVAKESKDSWNRATVLTVSVSLQESQLLAVAMEKGKLSVLVRNAGDVTTTLSPADVSASVLNDQKGRTGLLTPRRSAGPIELKEASR